MEKNSFENHSRKPRHCGDVERLRSRFLYVTSKTADSWQIFSESDHQIVQNQNSDFVQNLWHFQNIPNRNRIIFLKRQKSNLFPAVSQIILQHTVKVSPIPDQHITPILIIQIIFLQRLVRMDQLLSVAVRVRAESVNHHLVEECARKHKSTKVQKYRSQKELLSSIWSEACLQKMQGRPVRLNTQEDWCYMFCLEEEKKRSPTHSIP